MATHLVPHSEWLKTLNDEEFHAIVSELEERAELFSAAVRTIVNDECRRRGWPAVAGPKRW